MASSNDDRTSGPEIIQWLLDTRPLWPVPPMSRSKDEVQELKTVASQALALLTAAEQESVLKYYHVKDAKMSLASHLLKHLVITKYCHVPWSQSTISRDEKGKPCFTPPNAAEQKFIDFNVSHQAGIVSLIAAVGTKQRVDVGTDVVCVNERIVHDYAHIDKSGFFDWVDIYSDVFAESEVSYMKLAPVAMDLGGEVSASGKDALSRCQWRGRQVNITVREKDGKERNVTVESNAVIDAKLRRFYACWCLREAYIKMTGEALLAPWLRELEILEVSPPSAKNQTLGPNSLEAGETNKDFKIHFKGNSVTNVRMELTALGKDYMVGAAVRSANSTEQVGLGIGTWECLDFERDVLAFAISKS